MRALLRQRLQLIVSLTSLVKQLCEFNGNAWTFCPCWFRPNHKELWSRQCTSCTRQLSLVLRHNSQLKARRSETSHLYSSTQFPARALSHNAHIHLVFHDGSKAWGNLSVKLRREALDSQQEMQNHWMFLIYLFFFFLGVLENVMECCRTTGKVRWWSESACVVGWQIGKEGHTFTVYFTADVAL